MKKGFHIGTIWLFLLPSLLGMLIFYIIPYGASYVNALSDAKTGAFAGLVNFEDVFGSLSFQTAARNTVLFMLICVPINIIVPFMMAYFLHARSLRSSKRNNLFILAFLLPLVIPSGATVYFWRIMFDDYGFINKILNTLNMETIHFMQSDLSLMVVIVVFMFKNMGYNMVLFISGLGYISKEYYETAEVEGCGAWYTMRRITLVYIVPTAFVTLLMSIVNSFKIFREIFMLFGNYPFPRIYMLQHYMNDDYERPNIDACGSNYLKQNPF